MKYQCLLSAFFFIFHASWAQAEYRVFLLKISKRAPASSTPASPAAQTPVSDFRLVESTLDHIQYRYYYPLAADEDVTYIATWRCRGRTGDFKPHCPNPKAPPPEQLPQTPSS